MRRACSVDSRAVEVLLTTRKSGSLAILLTLGLAASLVPDGCRPNGPRPLEVTYYYLPG
jgi:hypothetical protein